MAAPLKQGLDYYPVSVGFFDSGAIVAVSKEFGLKGELASLKLLLAIAREGYFVEWSEPTRLMLARSMPGVSLGLLDQIVRSLVNWGFFDASLFNSANILTSASIQEVFFTATKRRKKTGEDYPYMLVNVNNNPVNVCNNPVNVDINPQSKVKKKNNSHYRGSCKKAQSADNNDHHHGCKDFSELIPSLRDVEGWCAEEAYAALGATKQDALDFLAYNEGIGWPSLAGGHGNAKALFYRWLKQKAAHVKLGRSPTAQATNPPRREKAVEPTEPHLCGEALAIKLKQLRELNDLPE